MKKITLLLTGLATLSASAGNWDKNDPSYQKARKTWNEGEQVRIDLLQRASNFQSGSYLSSIVALLGSGAYLHGKFVKSPYTKNLTLTGKLLATAGSVAWLTCKIGQSYAMHTYETLPSKWSGRAGY